MTDKKDEISINGSTAVEPDFKEPSKKLSNVIIELDRKIDLIVKMLANYDHTMKLLLSKANQPIVAAPVAPIVMASGDDDEFRSFDPSLVVGGEEHVIEIAKDIVGTRRTARKETYVPTSEMDVRKIPVSQRVTFPDGKLAYMADVEILNNDKSLLMKLRTTAGGKWMAALPVGSYYVNIVKRENGNRKKLSYLKEIEVKASETLIEFETAKLS